MLTNQPKAKKKRFKWNAFICHASEDKKTVVEPLFHELVGYGLHVWFDKFAIKVGDGLRQKIDKGLVSSRYGIVIFSPRFFAKQFPQTELDGLFSREMTTGRTIILPVWHEIDEAYLGEHANTLVGKWAARTDDGISEVARKLVEVIRPNALKLDHSRANAQSATAHLIQQLQQRNEPLTFRVLSGKDIGPQSPASSDAVVSIFDGKMRIDAIPKDSETYKQKPIGLSLTVKGDAVSKMNELIRTGKPQEFTGSDIVDFRYHNFDLGNLGQLDISKSKFYLGPADSATLPVRLIFGGRRVSPITIPYLDLTIERSGTEEFSLLATTPDHGFSLRNVKRSTPPDGFETHMKLEGLDVHIAQRYFRAILALRETGEFELSALKTDRILQKGTIELAKPSEEETRYGGMIDDVVSISDYLGLKVTWPDAVTRQDVELLAHLKALMDDRPIGTGASFVFYWCKVNDDLSRFDLLKSQGHVALVQEQPISFFGTSIEAGTLALFSESMCVLDFEEARDRLRLATIGETIPVSVATKAPVWVRLWRKLSAATA